MGSRLDNLALALTEPMSRRRALKLTAAAAATSFVSWPTDTARAACPTCPRMSDPPSYSQHCSVDTNLGCIFVCCPETFKCCTASHGVVCCREGYTCGPNQTVGSETYPSCKCENDCGGACCKPGEQCANSDLGLCCEIPCGVSCCEKGEKCVDPNRGTCCKPAFKGCVGKSETSCCLDTVQTCCSGSVVTQCCGPGQKCTDQGACVCTKERPVECQGDDCCRRTEKCCPGARYPGFCMSQGYTCCGDDAAGPAQACCAGRFVYRPAKQRCCGVSGVCGLNQECCPDGCCPEGTSCCAHGCCNFRGARVAAKQPFAHVPSRREVFAKRQRVMSRYERRRGARH
jgi:hypothetical protein